MEKRSQAEAIYECKKVTILRKSSATRAFRQQSYRWIFMTHKHSIAALLLKTVAPTVAKKLTLLSPILLKSPRFCWVSFCDQSCRRSCTTAGLR